MLLLSSLTKQIRPLGCCLKARGSDSSSKASDGPLTHLFGHCEETYSDFFFAHDVRIRTSSQEEGWLGPIRGRSFQTIG
jgi:hypothetical protein